MARKISTAPKQPEPDGFHEQAKEHMTRGEYADALGLLLKSLKEKKTADAYCDLGDVYRKLEKKNEAVVAFEEALKIDPGYARAHARYAEFLVAESYLFHAVDHYGRAVGAEPGNLEYKQSFLLVTSALQVRAFNKEVKEVLTVCLETEGMNFSASAVTWGELLLRDPGFRDLFKASGRDRKDSYESFSKAAMANHKKFFDPYFLLGIRQIIFANVSFEKFMTFLRRFLLEQYDAETKVFSDEEYARLAMALSHYCLLTEYVFDISPEEEAKIAVLRSREPDARLAPLLACYLYLGAFEDAAAISARLGKVSLPGMAAFVEDHIDDHLAQEELRRKISAIGKISDKVSLRVREQYEAFPYPRWSGYSSVAVSEGEDIDTRLHGARARILVAGCGTGREAINLAAKHPDSHVLAVDLSLASLAYGAKRARDYGIKNVDFRHGDILGLGILKERFDYIASAGVLHHMEDPAQGLAVLNGLLKPDGLMRLGLYSEIARRHIVEVRAVIQKKGYRNDAADIRRFRREAGQVLSKDALANLRRYRDYYTLSECRDLLFHVQEHRFTVPRLKMLLENENLEFMRFRFSFFNLAVPELYKKAYPQDPQGANLGNWSKFEEKNPDIFIEMYQFWCRRKAL